MIVYCLTHNRPRGEHVDWPLVNQKHLGFFSSQESARSTLEAASLLEGFREWPNAFTVEEIELDAKLFPDGFDVEVDRRLIPRD